MRNKSLLILESGIGTDAEILINASISNNMGNSIGYQDLNWRWVLNSTCANITPQYEDADTSCICMDMQFSVLASSESGIDAFPVRAEYLYLLSLSV